MYDDKGTDFCIVIEQITAEPPKNMEQFTSEDGIHFFRWRQCLQAADRRNRNGRHWPLKYLKPMTETPMIAERLKHGWPGEAGHPVPDTGKVTPERIMTIDPLRTSHIIRDISWEGNILWGTMESLADDNGPGHKLYASIRQGIDPAVSARTLVPQRVNNDGTIDVIGPGNLVCYDWVYGPSHPEAYIDISIPIKSVFKQDGKNYEAAIESFMGEYASDLLGNSEKIQRIVDRQKIVVESIIMGQNGLFCGKVENCDGNGTSGHVIIAPEMKYRNEYNDYLNNLFK